MKVLDEIKLLVLLRIKKSLRKRSGFFSRILTSFSFFGVYAIEIATIFFIKKNGFEDLNFLDFLAIFLAQQSIFMMWLAFGSSLDETQNKVLDGDFDKVILKPMNFWVFRYFNKFYFDNFFSSMMMFLIALILCFFNNNFFIFLNFALFVLIGMIVIVVFDSFISTFVFWERNLWKVKSFSEFLLNFFQKKPPEIFPFVFKSVLFSFVPYVQVFLGVFSVYKNENLLILWILILIWLFTVLILEKLFWKIGIKRYESIG